jgi:hypothetical protein
MSLFKPVCTDEKDKECLQKWRRLLLEKAKFKRIPLALIPMYINEKVNQWLLEKQKQLSFAEYYLLCQIFIPTNWESVAIHPSKVACILCAYVDTHDYESALVRSSSPEFLNNFFKAHIEDRSLSHSQQKILTSLIRERVKVSLTLEIFGKNLEEVYDGRSICTLFSKFMIDNPGLCVPQAVAEDLI